MHILIFNCGSSSQAFKVYQVTKDQIPAVIATGKAKNVATKTQASAFIEWTVQGRAGSKITPLPTQCTAALEILKLLADHQIRVDAVGHRFVHGGTLFDRTIKIDPFTLEKLKQCLPFAPIHNPNAYSVIEVCLDQLPGVPQYAVFDTAFHAGMPEVSRQYAIPKDLAEKFGFYKYGFHGLSYQYVSARAAELLGKPLNSLKLILCNLGTGGSSVMAMKDGKTLDTSMGFSPLPGLVMSTRCGDIDAEIVLDLIRQGYSADEVDGILNHQSGLTGLSGFSSNLLEIIEESEQGNADCRLAYDVYAQRLGFYLGAFTWLLNGADAIIFTDEIGMKAWKLREKVLSSATHLGITLDRDANQNAPDNIATRISSPDSKTQLWIIPTDEELVMLNEVLNQG